MSTRSCTLKHVNFIIILQDSYEAYRFKANDQEERREKKTFKIFWHSYRKYKEKSSVFKITFYVITFKKRGLFSYSHKENVKN